MWESKPSLIDQAVVSQIHDFNHSMMYLKLEVQDDCEGLSIVKDSDLQMINKSVQKLFRISTAAHA
jgi:hypothetical protein